MERTRPYFALERDAAGEKLAEPAVTGAPGGAGGSSDV